MSRVKVFYQDYTIIYIKKEGGEYQEMAEKKKKDLGGAAKYTPEQLEQSKKLAKQYYVDNKGIASIKVLARIGKVPQRYVTKWMKEENWNQHFMEDPDDKVLLSEDTKAILQSGAESFGLDEQEELFCYHYLKTFNATTSAIKAGYSSSFAHNMAYRLLKKSKIKDFLEHAKGKRNEELFLDGLRIIQEYMKIAFADMTDFVKFGSSGVKLRHSTKVDGQLITKISEGKNGVTIELADKMKALDKLEQYLQVMPEDWRRSIEEKKLELAQQKAELDLEDDDSEEDVVTIKIVKATRKDEE